MQRIFFWPLFGTLFLSFFYPTSAYKILGVLHFGGRSHHIVGSALMKELAFKGHEVTVISPFPLKEPLHNYKDIPTPGTLKAMAVDLSNLLDARDRNIIKNMINYHDMGYRVTEAALNEPGVQALMQSNQTFDAIIYDVFICEALYGLSELFKAPLIGLGTFGAISWNTDMVGSPSPVSYVPHTLLKYNDHMTLAERIGNLAFITFERVFLDFVYYPRQAALYEKHFPNNKRSMYEVMKDTAAVLLNQHVSLSAPRPYMPNQIEVGGMHINRKRKPLPENIQKFLDEAKDGAIYFSMGSNLKSKNLPLEKRRAILNTFRGLKQGVLWKFEEPNLEGKPDNVLISDWFPQDDILAHKNVRAFITHGGLLSLTETIYHGKPVVGIPVFGDQFLNMARAEKEGYGIKLDYTNLTEQTFKTAVERIANDPMFTVVVREISARYRDQPLEPMDLAVYWVEHIARHKGAKYLKCAGLELNFFQYHNIDAMLILYGGVLLVFALIGLIVRTLWRCLVKAPENKKRHRKKLKNN